MIATVPVRHTVSPAINRITQTVNQSVLTNDSLYTGNLGKALYYFYFYHHTNDPTYQRQGEEMLEMIFEKLRKGESKLTRRIALSRGLSGLAWSLHILSLRATH